MLEDSIDSSPHKANSSIHCTRMRRRNRSQRKLLKPTEETFIATAATSKIVTASATIPNDCSKQRNEEDKPPLATLADMYWDEDGKRESEASNRTFVVPAHFNPFEDQMLLALADRITSTQQRSSHNKHLPTTTKGFQKCESLEEADSCRIREETQIEISDTEMLQIWDQVEEAEKKAESLTNCTSLVDKTPQRAQQSKSIVDLILEDFGCSPLSPPVEFKRSMRTYSRRRRRKDEEGAGAANETLPSPRKSFAQQLEKVAAPSAFKFDDDDRLSICSTSSSLSMQEDRTQLPLPLPTLVDANVLNCSSEKLCQNLLNLSAYFTQQNQSEAEELSTPTTSVSETFQTAITEHENGIETYSQSTSQHIASSQAVAEILTLRQKYPVSFSRRSSNSSAEFCGFAAVTAGGDDCNEMAYLLANNSSQSTKCDDVLCSPKNSEINISPAQLTTAEHQCDVKSSNDKSVHKDELLFGDDDDEWLDDDCEFFANFKTQEAMQAVKSVKVHNLILPAKSPPSELKAVPTTMTTTKPDSAAAQLPQDLPELHVKKESHASKFQGFQTASRKTIQISAEAQKRAEALVAAIPIEKDLDFLDDDQPSTSKAATLKNTANQLAEKTETKVQLNGKQCNALTFQGFQTASRKTIQISEEAQKRAEALVAAIPIEEDLPFLDDEDDLPSTSKAALENTTQQTVKPTETKINSNGKLCNASKFQGFQTASRKTIVISEEAQKRAEAIVAAIPDMDDLDFLDNDDAAALKNTTQKPVKTTETKMQFNGFQTASRKTIQISEEAQKRAEALVAAVPVEEDLDFLDADDDQPSTSKAAALKNISHRSATWAKSKSCNFDVNIKTEQFQRLEQPVVVQHKSIKSPKQDFSIHIKNPIKQTVGIFPAPRKIQYSSPETRISANNNLAELIKTTQKPENTVPPVAVVVEQNSAETEMAAAALIAEEFQDIPFSEWPLTEPQLKTQEINEAKTVAAEATAAPKRKLHNEDYEIDKPNAAKLLCKSHSASSLQRSPLHRIENATKLPASPANSAIISRRNLLSLSKRKRNRPSSTVSSTQVCAEPSPNTLTPIKTKANCANAQTPGTPNLREFFDSLPTNTSTPRPFKDASISSRALDNQQEEEQETAEDFTRNKCQSGSNSLRNCVDATSKTDAIVYSKSKSFSTTSGGNGVINASLNMSGSKLSPKERIERLSMYGEPPAVSPMASHNSNSCRRVGLRRAVAGRSLTLNKSKR